MRADAQQNRRAIVAAARTVFREDGLDASLTEVARRAGVGVATLYRRFPDRHCLVTAVFAEQMDEFVAVAGTAVADPDPWHGFCTYVETVCAMQEGGRLRPEFTDQDLALLMLSNDGLLDRTSIEMSEAWRRPVAWLLVAWDAQGVGAGPLPRPPARSRIRRALEV